MFNKTTIATLLAALLYLPFTASAGPITIDHQDSGWYTKYGYHNKHNQDYFAGYNDNYRNFFAFDLSGVTQNIVSATLRLYSSVVSRGGTYKTYAVSTSIGDLLAGGYGKTDIFNDLGTGTNFGSRYTGHYEDYKVIDIALNSAAIASLNAANSIWAIGGRYSSFYHGYAFANTYNKSYVRQLVLNLQPLGEQQPVASVPEPTMMALIGLGFVGMWGFNRRRMVN